MTKTKEITTPQILTGDVIDSVLPSTKTATLYATYREMRKDPTIALARALSIAPILAAPWAVESIDEAPEGAHDFIDFTFQPLRIHLLDNIMKGNIDFGWAPFEKVFKIERNGLITYKKLKPLLQDLTEILIDEKTGSFIGLRQQSNDLNNIDIDLSNSLLVSLDVEGTNWYGYATLENVRSTYNKSKVVEATADRYDAKVAGSHWIVYYPLGKSEFNGTLTENSEIAKWMLSNLQSTGTVMVPSHIQEFVEGINESSEPAWKIDLLSDQGSAGAQFTQRLSYLDKLKVRGFQLPERAVLEGQFGTKAEAEAHSDFAITNMELKHEKILQQINWHCVNQLIRFNWGEEFENTVSIVPTPINDQTRLWLREIYTALIQNPEGFLSEFDSIDFESLKDKIGVPIRAQHLSEDEDNEVDEIQKIIDQIGA